TALRAGPGLAELEFELPACAALRDAGQLERADLGQRGAQPDLRHAFALHHRLERRQLGQLVVERNQVARLLRPIAAGGEQPGAPGPRASGTVRSWRGRNPAAWRVMAGSEA